MIKICLISILATCMITMPLRALGARKFTGSTSNYLSAGVGSSGVGFNSPSTALTLSVWVQPTTTGNCGLIAKGDVSNSSHTEYVFYWNASDIFFKFGNGTSAEDVFTAGAGPTTGAWHNLVALERNTAGGGVQIWQDGVNKLNSGTLGNTIGLSSYALAFGINYSNSSTPNVHACNGYIGEIAIWSVDLHSQEVAALWSGVSASCIRPSSLVGYWNVYGANSPEPDEALGQLATVNGTLDQIQHPPVGPPCSSGNIH